MTAPHHVPNPPAAAPPRVAVVGSAGERIRDEVEQLLPVIRQHTEVLLVDLENRGDLSQLALDFLIVLGGDGSILRAAQQMGERQVPVLGVNLGRLGFLADLASEELGQVLPAVCTGAYRVVEHVMLTCQVVRDVEVVCRVQALNEVAVLGGPPYSLLEIDLYVDTVWATTYSCDGLIISTPVGSTAHNLSTGGPILRKDLQAVVISPISPHTLTMRPVVDSADCAFEMQVRRRNEIVGDEQTAVVVDGVVVHVLAPGDRILVTRARPKFLLIEVAGRGYYRTLREKLGWSGGIRPAL